MKTCPQCTTENADDAAVCTNCAFKFPVAAPETPPEASAPAPDADPTPAPPPKAPVLRFEPRGNRPDERKLNWRPPAPAEEKTQGGDAEPSGPPPRDLSPLDQKLVEIERSGLLTIGIIGFATSGKTFFINRLKEYMASHGDFRPVPAPDKDGTTVEGTREIETHEFEALPTAINRGTWLSPQRVHLNNFHMIDIPGERFRSAVEAYLQGAEAETLLKVLRLSHALIIVLPADEVFAEHADVEEVIAASDLLNEKPATLGSNATAAQIKDHERKLDEWEKKLEAHQHAVAEIRLNQLLTAVSTLSAHASKDLDRTERDELAQFLNLSDEERSSNMVRHRRGAAPLAYVAFAKADTIIKPKLTGYKHIKKPELLDIDPGAAFRVHRRKLRQRIDECFAWYKFDFVSCFKGQRSNDKKIRYAREHHGVGDVVDWILWARDYSLETGRRRPEGTRRWSFKDIWRGIDSVLVGAGLFLLGVSWPLAALAALVLFGALWLFRDRLMIVRLLGRWRENGSVTDPKHMGLDPRPYNLTDETAGDRFRRWIGKRIEGAFKPRGDRSPRSGQPVPILLSIVLALILAPTFFWLVGGFGTLSPSPQGYAFNLQPVYRAEIQRMEQDNKDFGTGFVRDQVSRWDAIPSDGGWFNFSANSSARGALQNALARLPASGAPGTLDPEAYSAVTANLETAANADLSEARGANSYHQGLALLLTKQYPAAAAAFEKADQAINDKIQNGPGNVPNRARYDETTYRLYAARVSILYAQGVAELKQEKWAEAAKSFGVAAQIAQEHSAELFDLSAAGQFWFPVTTHDPSPMLHVSTADIWTNLLFALIHQHKLAVEAAKVTASDEVLKAAEDVRKQLQVLVEKAADHADEAARHPELAANLTIAAARSGASIPGKDDNGPERLLSRFHIDGANEQQASVRSYAGVIAAPDISGHSSAAYWKVTQEWRSELDARINQTPAEKRPQLQERLSDNSNEEPGLKAWLCDVLETQYRDASPSDKRALTRNYGEYNTCGMAQSSRLRDAASPFGLAQGFLLSILLLYLVARLVSGYRAIGEMFQKLYVARHRPDRLTRR